MAEYLTLFSFFTIGPALVLLWLAAVALYRMTLHPLAGIPGPKLAAISGLHEAWWSAVKRGRYLLKYDQMHEDYGRASTGTKTSKGARSCIGHELAKRWLCVLCANLFRRLPSPELFDTTRRDVEPAFELFGPVPWEGSRGLRVKIRDVD
ncbi:hypothetical protein BKA81DRAFT_406074 [Phyllosticta paracitricarpa]